MKLVALHGSTMNGAVMRGQLAALQAALPDVEVIAPDGPVACSMETVDRLYQVWHEPRQPGPYCVWWDTSDDGREYRGWDATCELMRSVIPSGPVGLVGFSQGAILAAAVAAMAAHGEMPPIDFVVLIAGRPPRADVIKPFLDRPIAVPSLHVWGANDQIVGTTPAALVELFAPATREVVIWPGEHTVPTTGSGAEAIAEFIGRCHRA